MPGTGGDMPMGGTDDPGDVPDPVVDGCQPNPDNELCPQICPELCNDADDDCDNEVDEGTDNTDCAVDNADSVCVEGLCLLTSCDDGFRDCDGDIDNGCEGDISSVDDCGGCNNVCAFDNAVPACVDGACEPAGCVEPYLDCDGSPEACETPGDTLTNCGTCGSVCGNLDHATTACDGEQCTVDECIGNFGDCNDVADDGCELELAEIGNCGACGTGCAFPGSVAECTTGICIATDCGPSFADCDGDATNGCESLNDAGHCGGCGQVCTVESLENVASASCDDLVCNSACLPLFADCDGQPNGCETPLNTTNNCGDCGTPCNPENAVGTCDDGSCGIGECADGWADCDGEVDNGCETNLTDPATCGSCDQQCPPMIGCAGGVCTGITCDPGEADCDGDDTCEADLTTDATCGACNVQCEFDQGLDGHGGVACVVDGGQLGYACEVTCDDGFADCDGDYRNGCEVDLTELDNCGACGDVCSKQHASPTCDNRICEVDVCDEDWGDCDGDGLSCESQLNTGGHCGSCGNGCDYDNAVGTCTGSPGARSCELVSCNPVEFADCNMDDVDGCEIDTASDGVNCDGCGNVCADQPNVRIASCQGSACVFDSCDGGYEDCNDSPGCETDTTQVATCGDCNTDCDATLPNTDSTTCGQSERCGIGSCTGGYDSCDGDALSGCETRTDVDADNCGGCASDSANDPCTGLPQVASSTCVAGDCVIDSCGDGYDNCDGDTTDGCETNTDSDPAACGACGNDCAALPNVGSAGCSAGACGNLVCDPGYLDCNGDVGDGCETDATDPSTCGGCSTDCDSSLPNTETTTCGVSEACGIGTCVAGFDSCDNDALNGCEQNIAMDEANCGGCASRSENQPCESLDHVITSTCGGGICNIVDCDPGYEDCNQLSADGCEWEPAVDGMCCDANNDADNDGADDCADECINDPAKQTEGVCGCGVSDADDDGDGFENCIDSCSGDPNKQDGGICGCGVSDADTDSDGFEDCLEACIDDPAKQDPGICGCDVSDTDTDSDGFEDCNETCDNDPNKQDPGACGCGQSDADDDGDGFENCNETCTSDGNKQDPGVCGCGIADDDSDGDGTLDCNDQCPFDAGIVVAGDCGCPSSPAGAGAFCDDGLCDANTQCDGAGQCGSRFECVPHKTVSAGNDTACGLDSSGRVICWGDGGVGQLGFGSTENYRRTGSFVGNIDDAVEVDFGAGGNHACALRANGEVVCWGEGAVGRLGNDSTADQHLPVTVWGITTAIQVSTGSDFSCALLESGEVRCWGEGAAGRLGYDSVTDSHTPVAVHAGETGGGNLSGVMHIASGEQHTCAVLESGHAVCWGEGASGRLGDSGTGNDDTPVYVHSVEDAGTCDAGDQSGCLVDVTLLAAGENVTLAIHGGGLVSSWGADTANESGYEGAGHDFPRRVNGLDNVGTLDDAIWVGMGLNHGCAVRQGGQAVCWGEDDHGRLGDDNLGGANPDHPVNVVGATDYAQISPGDLFTCAHAEGGHVRCFGDNAQGNLADGTSTDRDVPTEMAGTQDPFVQADVLANGCGVTSTGEVYCWGRQDAGVLGNPDHPATTDVWAAIKVDQIDNAVDVTVGEHHACALLDNGKVRCWGDNSYYNLGIGPVTTDQYTPGWVTDPGNMPDTDCTYAEHDGSGYWFCRDGRDWATAQANCQGVGMDLARIDDADEDAAIRARIGVDTWIGGSDLGVEGDWRWVDNDALYWRGNGSGSAQNGAYTNWSPSSSQPEQGANANCAAWWISGDGWSDSDCDGTRDYVCEGSPQPDGPLADVIEIAGSWRTTCALKSDGTVWCWGEAGYGTLGNATTGPHQGYPVQVHGVGNVGMLTGAEAIGAGRHHMCATQGNSPDRTMVCWGYNGLRQLGDGTTTTRSTPVVVGGGHTGFAAGRDKISGGLYNSCALKDNGEAYCWGYDALGKNGDGVSGGYNDTPSKVAGGLDDFVVISDDSDDASSVCAARQNGEVHCWGYNDNGERGDEGAAGIVASPSRAHYTEAAADQGNPDFNSPVVDIGSGYHSKVAVHADGSISTFGYNGWGQLGTGYTGDKSQPVRLGVPVR